MDGHGPHHWKWRRLSNEKMLQESIKDDDHEEAEQDHGVKSEPSDDNAPAIERQEPFMGLKPRRLASFRLQYRGDYLDVPSHPHLIKLLHKQGDKNVLFADKVIKVTGSGKMKRRILLITDFAIFIVDPENDALKRRIVLAAVECMCLSKLSDNFIAIIIPTEYDLLMASTRKNEIVTVLVEATRSASEFQLEVLFSNRFEYHAAAEVKKEVEFEEVEGGVKTKITTK